MTEIGRRVSGWYHAALVSLVVWLVVPKPLWAMLAVVAILPVHRAAVRSRSDEPWRSLLVATAAFSAFGFFWGAIPALVFVAMAVSLALGSEVSRGVESNGRPDGWDVALIAVALVGTSAGSMLLGLPQAVWFGAVCAGLALRRAAGFGFSSRAFSGASTGPPGPPDREIRGTVSLSGVLTDRAGTPRTVAVDLLVRAGSSVAIVCDDPAEIEALQAALTGCRAPLSGEFVVDASPPAAGERLAAVIAPGEPFLCGTLETNLMALAAGDHMSADLRAALHESFGLGEVESALQGRNLTSDGEPLEPYHRLLVLAARIVPSAYRLLVVVDPRPWVNTVRGEVWRNAVVRASVGRTAVWLTSDRDLCSRADEVLELRHGALRPEIQSAVGGT